MKVNRDWNAEEELAEDVYQALEDAGLYVLGSEEQSSYGDDGFILVRKDGRTFYLELTEEL